MIMNNLERDNLIDGFFNKGYACDLKDVYQAVMGTIKDLEQANDEKVEKIERLNNIINRMEINLKEMYMTFGEFNEEYTEKKIRELKGSNDNVH